VRKKKEDLLERRTGMMRIDREAQYSQEGGSRNGKRQERYLLENVRSLGEKGILKKEGMLLRLIEG